MLHYKTASQRASPVVLGQWHTSNLSRRIHLYFKDASVVEFHFSVFEGHRVVSNVTFSAHARGENGKEAFADGDYQSFHINGAGRSTAHINASYSRVT
jgi:hypothetical protein